MAGKTKVTMEWIDPSPDRGSGVNWGKVSAALRARPGEWALVLEDAPVSVANAVRQGSVRIMHPDLGFEVKTRKNTGPPGRRCDLYIRYVEEGKP